MIITYYFMKLFAKKIRNLKYNYIEVIYNIFI